MGQHTIRAAFRRRWSTITKLIAAVRLPEWATIAATTLASLWGILRDELPAEMQPPHLTDALGLLAWWAWLIVVLAVALVLLFEAAVRLIHDDDEPQGLIIEPSWTRERAWLAIDNHGVGTEVAVQVQPSYFDGVRTWRHLKWQDTESEWRFLPKGGHANVDIATVEWNNTARRRCRIAFVGYQGNVSSEFDWGSTAWQWLKVLTKNGEPASESLYLVVDHAGIMEFGRAQGSVSISVERIDRPAPSRLPS